jgi:hypothetical protein
MSEQHTPDDAAFQAFLEQRAQELHTVVPQPMMIAGSMESALRARIAAVESSISDDLIDLEAEKLEGELYEPSDKPFARMKQAVKREAKRRNYGTDD